MERAIGRLSLGRGGPRDLLALAGSLSQTNKLHEDMRNLDLPGLLADARNALTGHHALADQLTDALKPEVPHLARDGNFIADGHRADLDEYRRLRDESRRVIAAMETQLKTDTGIPSLKIKHNNVLGYFIEITPIHEKKVPVDFIHRQGLAGALRYTTPELSDTARKIEEAADKALKLELALFEELTAMVLAASPAIIAAARALAVVDVVLALAQLAEEGAWVRPRMVSAPHFVVRGGRHPVVEAALRRQHLEFIANDCVMGDIPPPAGGGGRLHLITGPNMGGKSTTMRQVALIVLLAKDAAAHGARLDGLEHGEPASRQTVAVGRGASQAWYADITNVPNVPDAITQRCTTPLGQAVRQAFSEVPFLDGSQSSCDWQTDADSVQPGSLGLSRLPFLLRDDYVENSNDSYWIINANAPSTGYPAIMGSTTWPLSLRTRLAHTMIRERLTGSDGNTARSFSRDALNAGLSVLDGA